MKKHKKSKDKKLYEELQHYKEAGIKLLLDGRPSSPKKIAKACSLGEEKTYMRDYVPGEVNEIQKIEFIHVKNIG